MGLLELAVELAHERRVGPQKPRQAASSAGESAAATGVVVVAIVAPSDCVCNDGSSARGDRQRRAAR